MQSDMTDPEVRIRARRTFALFAFLVVLSWLAVIGAIEVGIWVISEV